MCEELEFKKQLTTSHGMTRVDECHLGWHEILNVKAVSCPMLGAILLQGGLLAGSWLFSPEIITQKLY